MIDNNIDQNQPSELYIGLMSGTSVDSIDAALVRIDATGCELLASHDHPIPDQLRRQLIELCQPSDNEIDRMGEADSELGKEFASAVIALLKTAGLSCEAIRAIGSHGQTIRHRPAYRHPFTLQIGDPNTIAQRTQITTVADFRRRDIAIGGQGAPLAPAFHRAHFGSSDYNRAIINIGGIANITYLGRDGDYLGFDTGPGNSLLDAWITQQLNRAYDANGNWGASGSAIPELLAALLSHPYFSQPLPKSTGREDFNLDWLNSILADASITTEQYTAVDVQATLLEMSAQSIIREVKQLPAPVDEIYICGGGAYNGALMARLQSLLPSIPVSDTAPLGIAPEWVEAAAFAWLASQTLAGKPGNLRQATGAHSEVILGAIFPV